jgi:hypothetical protein
MEVAWYQTPPPENEQRAFLKSLQQVYLDVNSKYYSGHFDIMEEQSRGGITCFSCPLQDVMHMHLSMFMTQHPYKCEIAVAAYPIWDNIHD